MALRKNSDCTCITSGRGFAGHHHLLCLKVVLQALGHEARAFGHHLGPCLGQRRVSDHHRSGRFVRQAAIRLTAASGCSRILCAIGRAAQIFRWLRSVGLVQGPAVMASGSLCGAGAGRDSSINSPETNAMGQTSAVTDSQSARKNLVTRMRATAHRVRIPFGCSPSFQAPLRTIFCNLTSRPIKAEGLPQTPADRRIFGGSTPVRLDARRGLIAFRARRW